MQEKQENNQRPGASQNAAGEQESEHKMAQNPNPRANENIKDTPFEKNTDSGSASDVGSEITDGEAS